MTDVGAEAREARDARKAGDAKEPPTTATRSSSKTPTTAMKCSKDGHSSAVKNTSMEHGRDVLAKNGSLLAEKKIISCADVARKGTKQ